MTRERLESLSLESLRILAAREGTDGSFEGSREELIDQLLEAIEENREDQEGDNNEAMRLKGKKYDIFLLEEIETQEKAEYPLPEKYNETKIMLLLRDPLWAFAYWEIKEGELESLREKPYFDGIFLRVHELDGAGGTVSSFDISVTETDRSWYVNLNRSGGTYRIDLMSMAHGREKLLQSSNTVQSPLAYIAENKDDFFSDPDYMMLVFSGLWDFDEKKDAGGVPRRILTILDHQDLAVSP